MRRHLDTIALSLLAATSAWLFAGLRDFGVYLPWLWTLVVAGFFSLFLLPLVIWRYRRIKLGIYVAFLLSTVVFVMVPMTSRQFFVNRLHRVKPGMTVPQVEALMKPVVTDKHSDLHRARGGGESGTISYRNNDWAYGGDFGTISFRDGRVIRVEFSPD